MPSLGISYPIDLKRVLTSPNDLLKDRCRVFPTSLSGLQACVGRSPFGETAHDLSLEIIIITERHEMKTK